MLLLSVMCISILLELIMYPFIVEGKCELLLSEVRVCLWLLLLPNKLCILLLLEVHVYLYCQK